MTTLNLPKIVRFCIDFLVPIPKLTVTAQFKRLSPDSPQIGFEQFVSLIDRLFTEVNRLKIKEMRKKSGDNKEQIQRLKELTEVEVRE